MRFAIYKDSVKVMPAGKLGATITVPMDEFLGIVEQVTRSRHAEDYSYTGFCLGCDRYDNLAQGFCKPCFDKRGLEYEEGGLTVE